MPLLIGDKLVVSMHYTLKDNDGNHPLAGMDLHFAVEITAVREATGEEIDHGHAH